MRNCITEPLHRVWSQKCGGGAQKEVKEKHQRWEKEKIEKKSRGGQAAKDEKEIDQQGKGGGLGRQRKEGGIRKRK